MIAPNFVTTNFQIDGYRIVESCGIVRGIVVRSRSIIGNFFGMLRMIFGGRMKGYTKLCDTARQQAYDEMTKHAQALGANAVIGFRYDATELMRGLTEVLAYGTACKVEKI
jgi:uncharacterized protein YbjQ (UPF0145 family)